MNTVQKIPLNDSEKGERIRSLLEELNKLPKGDRSEKGKPIRRKLRSLGYRLSIPSTHTLATM